MANTTIILPFTPAPIKKFLEAKRDLLSKLSSGELAAINDIPSKYAHTEIPERLRNKYKSKE